VKRIVLDVPKWHVFLHRDARGLEATSPRDDAARKFEDELFDRVYAGESERLPDREQDPKLRAWADGVHAACDRLPAFHRLVEECRGEPLAAGTAVEALMAELTPQLPTTPEQPPPQNIRRIVGSACQQASASIDELRDAIQGLESVGVGWGSGTAVGCALPGNAIRSLAARLRSDDRLKRIALLAGRFKRIAASKRRQKLKHGADEIADIEQGADLGRLLPSELLKLSHPRLRAAFLRSYVERAALQYELIGHESLGRGPVVVLLDKSGSMDGPRDLWATALTLALLDQAQRERRVFALVCFDDHVKFEAVVKPGEAMPEQGLFVSCAGGTDIGAAVVRGLEIIKGNEGPLRTADIVLVTDGASDTASAAVLREAARLVGVTSLGLGIGVEREWLLPWCDEVQTVSNLDNMDDAVADRLFAS
jgi:Mg-chelatase subunit ChlD